MIVRRLVITTTGTALPGLVAVAPWRLLDRSDPCRFLEKARDRRRAADSPICQTAQRRDALRRWIAKDRRSQDRRCRTRRRVVGDDPARAPSQRPNLAR